MLLKNTGYAALMLNLKSGKMQPIEFDVDQIIALRSHCGSDPGNESTNNFLEQKERSLKDLINKTSKHNELFYKHRL